MYNSCIYSTIKFGTITLPTKIHISKIKKETYYKLENYENFGVYDSSNQHLDLTSDFFYGKFRETLQAKRILSILYDFIDYENMDLADYFMVFPRDKHLFIELIMESDMVSFYELGTLYKQLLECINLIKVQFVKTVSKQYEVEKEYPKVAQKTDVESTKSYKKYKEHMKMNPAMGDLACYVDVFPNPIFPENVGIAVSEYSWRELELRKIYLKAKGGFDDFSEKVKGAIMDDLSPSDSNK